MKTSMRSTAQLFLAILLFGQSSLCAQEQWFAKHLLNCKQKKTSPVESRDSIAFLRPYPFETKKVNLELDGQNLLQFLAIEESIARSVDKRIWLSAQSSSDDSTNKEKSKNPFFFSSQTKSDSVLIVRENSAFVFPRFMLLNPFFQQIAIKDGDFISTVRSRYNPDEKKDPVGDFLFPSKAPARAAKISVSAVGSKQGAIEIFMGGFQATANRATLDVFFGPVKTFESTAYEPQSENLLDQRLLMLTRVRSGLFIHYLIPFKESGALGFEGVLTKNATNDPVDYNVWTNQTMGLQSVLLQDGDKISVVTLVSATTELR